MSCYTQDIFSTFPYLVWHLLLLPFHLCLFQISPSALFIWAQAAFRSSSFSFLFSDTEGLSTSPSNLYILISQTVWGCGIWIWLLLGYYNSHMKAFSFNVCWHSFPLSCHKYSKYSNLLYSMKFALSVFSGIILTLVNKRHKSDLGPLAGLERISIKLLNWNWPRPWLLDLTKHMQWGNSVPTDCVTVSSGSVHAGYHSEGKGWLRLHYLLRLTCACAGCGPRSVLSLSKKIHAEQKLIHLFLHTSLLSKYFGFCVKYKYRVMNTIKCCQPSQMLKEKCYFFM